MPQERASTRCEAEPAAWHCTLGRSFRFPLNIALELNIDGHPSPLSQNKVHSVNIKVHSTPLEVQTSCRKYLRSAGEYWRLLSRRASVPKKQNHSKSWNFLKFPSSKNEYPKLATRHEHRMSPHSCQGRFIRCLELCVTHTACRWVYIQDIGKVRICSSNSSRSCRYWLWRFFVARVERQRCRARVTLTTPQTTSTTQDTAGNTTVPIPPLRFWFWQLKNPSSLNVSAHQSNQTSFEAEPCRRRVLLVLSNKCIYPTHTVGNFMFAPRPARNSEKSLKSHRFGRFQPDSHPEALTLLYLT